MTAETSFVGNENYSKWRPQDRIFDTNALFASLKLVLYKNWILGITELHKWIYFLVLLYKYIIWWNCIIGQEIDFWTPIHCKRMIGKNIFDYINNILFQIEKVGTIGNVVLIFY